MTAKEKMAAIFLIKYKAKHKKSCTYKMLKQYYSMTIWEVIKLCFHLKRCTKEEKDFIKSMVIK